MKSIRSLIVPVVLALGMLSVASPVLAGAKDQRPAKELREDKADKRQKPNFPMKAEDFRKMVNERIEKIQARFDQMIAKRNPPAEKKAEMKKAFDEGIAKVKAAVDKAAADNTVTQEEAKEVRKAVKEQRKQMRAHLGKGKHKGGKHKGDKKDRDTSRDA